MSDTNAGIETDIGAPRPETAGTMRLCPEPPRVTRLSRKVLAGVSAAALLGIGGALIYALQTRDPGPGGPPGGRRKPKEIGTALGSSSAFVQDRPIHRRANVMTLIDYHKIRGRQLFAPGNALSKRLQRCKHDGAWAKIDRWRPLIAVPDSGRLRRPHEGPEGALKLIHEFVCVCHDERPDRP